MIGVSFITVGITALVVIAIIVVAVLVLKHDDGKRLK